MSIPWNALAQTVTSKIILASVATAVLACAQQPRTVLDGVYTAAQAERGQAQYNRYCSGCHGGTLDGGGAAPPLHTDVFLDNWREDFVSSLFHQIQTRMPPSKVAASIREEQYVDIVAHILAINEFPAGAKELTRADLDATFLIGLDGPKPMPQSATVLVAGCVVQSGTNWTLTRSGAPTRVRDGAETDPAELERSKQAALGTNTFRLTNLDEDHTPAQLLTYVGKKAQVKGVLSGQPAAARIYVLNFQTLAQDCQ